MEAAGLARDDQRCEQVESVNRRGRCMGYDWPCGQQLVDNSNRSRQLDSGSAGHDALGVGQAVPPPI